MASKKSKVETTLTTGLNETPEQIEALTAEKAKALMTIAKQGAKANVNDLLEAAYQFGLAERRRRKLARKINKTQGAEE